MALEVSISASAQRLQAQQDRQARLQREQQAAEAADQRRQQDRLRAERLREEDLARNAERSQRSRDISRIALEQRRADEARISDTRDQRSDDRNARQAAENEAALADARFTALQRDNAQAAAALSNPATAEVPAPSRDGTPQETLRQLLAERNNRLSERDAAQRQFAAQQQQDLLRAQRSIEALRNDPSSFPATPTRGEVVDVQA